MTITITNTHVEIRDNGRFVYRGAHPCGKNRKYAACWLAQVCEIKHINDADVLNQLMAVIKEG